VKYSKYKSDKIIKTKYNSVLFVLSKFYNVNLIQPINLYYEKILYPFIAGTGGAGM